MAVHAPIGLGLHDQRHGMFGRLNVYDRPAYEPMPSISSVTQGSSTNAAGARATPSLPKSLVTILNTSEDAADDGERKRKIPEAVRRMPSLPSIGTHAQYQSSTHDRLPPATRPILAPRSPLQRSLSHMNLRAVRDGLPLEGLRTSSLTPISARIDEVGPSRHLARSPYADTRSEAPRSTPESGPWAPRVAGPPALRHANSGDFRPMSARDDTFPSRTNSRLGDVRLQPRPKYMDQPQGRDQLHAANRHPTASVVAGPSNPHRAGYQVMALQTSSGVVNLPVDIDMASKVADDKRKRNAGASARFRSRRKQREMVAADKIQLLEQQARILTDTVEFYRNERDHFRDMLRQESALSADIFDRPPSPQLRVEPGTSPALSSRAASVNSGEPDFVSDEARRRTSSFPSSAVYGSSGLDQARSTTLTAPSYCSDMDASPAPTFSEGQELRRDTVVSVAGFNTDRDESKQRNTSGTSSQAQRSPQLAPLSLPSLHTVMTPRDTASYRDGLQGN